MNTTKKLIIAVVALSLALVAFASVTLAWLIDDTEIVKNTFTVGKVNITLDEALVDDNGKATTGDRVTANKYVLMPGSTYDKDPTVHVSDDSEDCWLFVMVDNKLANIESTADGYVSIAEQMTNNGWTPVSGATNVYAYNQIVSAGAEIKVFENFTIDGGTVTKENIEQYKGEQITVQAYAIQAANLNSATDAWAAAPFNAWVSASN